MWCHINKTHHVLLSKNKALCDEILPVSRQPDSRHLGFVGSAMKIDTFYSHLDILTV